VKDKNELVAEINKHNGILSCYCTVYKFRDHDNYLCIYDTAIIDRVFFDFDDENAFDDILKMEKYYSKLNIKRAILFSGGGYHFYIKCKRVTENKRGTLRGYQEYITDKLKLLPDTNVFGDIARIARIPNTYNRKRRKFCIAIKPEWLKKGDKWIRKRAGKPHKWFEWHGEKVENIEGHEVNIEPLMPQLDNIEIRSDIKKKYKNFSNTAKKMLSDNNLRWKNRGALINYLFEQGYFPEEVIDLLWNKLNKDRAKHTILQEKQVWHLWRNRYRYVAPAWVYA
jgi:hypothetical protein